MIVMRIEVGEKNPPANELQFDCQLHCVDKQQAYNNKLNKQYVDGKAHSFSVGNKPLSQISLIQ